MDVLERKLSYDEVTEIFVRVNSLGAKLRSSDLALPQITAKWRNSLKTFETFQQECTQMGFELDLGLYLKNLVVCATGQSRFLTVGSLQVSLLKQAWTESVAGMQFALNFIRNNLKIDSPALLSSPFLLITLAFYGHTRKYELSSDEAQMLRYWALIANTKGRYSKGSSETILDQDLAIIRNKLGVQDLVERLRQQVGRLDIEPEELVGRNQRSAIFKAMFLAFRESGAKDWKSHVAIGVNNTGSHHKVQFHHICPKALLKGHVLPREIDDIGNLCFISGKTNRQISDKPPSQYFEPILATSGEGAFAAQCIPIEAGFIQSDTYNEFLKERRVRIAQRLNEFLKAPNNISQDSA